MLLRDEDLTRLLPVGCADDAPTLHGIDELCRSAVAEGQPSLNEGCGNLSALQCQLNGVIQHGIHLAVVAARVVAALMRLSATRRLPFDGGDNLFVVDALTVALVDEIQNGFNLLFAHESALHTNGLDASDRRIQHIAAPDQLLRTRNVQNGAGVHLRSHRKGDTGRNVRLDQSRDDVHGGALCTDDEMHACGARLLCQTADRFLHVVGRGHHKIRQLVDDNDDLRQEFLFGIVLCHLVIGFQITHAHLLDQGEPTFHFSHRPLQGACRLFGVADHGNEQMRQTVIDIQLHLFGVNEDQLHLVRRRLIQKADDHGVDTHRFTHTGSAGNQQMRHLRDIQIHRRARHVLAQRDRDAACRLRKLRIFNEAAQIHGLHRAVRHLDAHRLLARDGCFDAHARGRQIQGNIVHQIQDGAHADALLGRQLITGDGRSARHIDDAGAHLEAAQGIHQLLRRGLQFLGYIGIGGLCALIQKRNRRELIRGRLGLFHLCGHSLGYGGASFHRKTFLFCRRRVAEIHGAALRFRVSLLLSQNEPTEDVLADGILLRENIGDLSVLRISLSRKCRIHGTAAQAGSLFGTEHIFLHPLGTVCTIRAVCHGGRKVGLGLPAQGDGGQDDLLGLFVCRNGFNVGVGIFCGRGHVVHHLVGGIGTVSAASRRCGDRLFCLRLGADGMILLPLHFAAVRLIPAFPIGCHLLPMPLPMEGAEHIDAVRRCAHQKHHKQEQCGNGDHRRTGCAHQTAKRPAEHVADDAAALPLSARFPKRRRGKFLIFRVISDGIRNHAEHHHAQNRKDNAGRQYPVAHRPLPEQRQHAQKHRHGNCSKREQSVKHGLDIIAEPAVIAPHQADHDQQCAQEQKTGDKLIAQAVGIARLDAFFALFCRRLFLRSRVAAPRFPCFFGVCQTFTPSLISKTENQNQRPSL